MAEVRIHAQFPISGHHNPASLDPNNFIWIHCLTFPSVKLSELQLSLKPYKWICYATSVVVGAQGELSTHREATISIDYDAALPSEPIDLYYRTTDEERVHMFPVDPKLADTKATSSIATSHRANFREEVSERDGRQCVLSGAVSEACDAVHLLPHSRGDSYIRMFTEGRGQEGEIIKAIDDVRNGIFLRADMHRLLGKNLAFLKTPNFALKTNDIVHGTTPDESRCTVQFFAAHSSGSARGADGHMVYYGPNSQLSIPENLAQWPPGVLFDIVYASAVFKHFGAKDKDGFSDAWQDICFPGIEELHEAEIRHQDDKGHRGKAREEQRRFHDRGAWSTWDALALGRYMFMPPEELKALVHRRREEHEAAEHKELESKVRGWRSQCT